MDFRIGSSFSVKFDKLCKPCSRTKPTPPIVLLPPPSFLPKKSPLRLPLVNSWVASGPDNSTDFFEVSSLMLRVTLSGVLYTTLTASSAANSPSNGSYPPRKNGNGFSLLANPVKFLFFRAAFFVCGKKILFHLSNMFHHFFMDFLDISF